jgi:elongation of very long chain fatty acids protein 4
MCIEAGVRAYTAGYSLLPCNKFNSSEPPIAFILYVFYISKILDFLDTFFIIAEKRFKQLSFLHVYHHTSIFLVSHDVMHLSSPVISCKLTLTFLVCLIRPDFLTFFSDLIFINQFYWLNLNVGYDGDVYVTIVLNGVIHTVMYTYYFVSLHTKEIWWKSALTMCQMVQFVLMNAQAMYLIATECTEFPRNITIAYGYYIVTLLLLFAHFFVTSYVIGKKKKPSKKVE